MIFKNAQIFHAGNFWQLDVKVIGSTITEIGLDLHGGDIIDLKSKLLLPGFVDIHTHGCAGVDFSNLNVSEINILTKEYAKRGVTSILATTMSIPFERQKAVLAEIAKSMSAGTEGCSILGINMEGPYFSGNRKGSHNKSYLQPVSLSNFKELDAAADGNIIIVNIDPTLANSNEFIKEISKSKIISLAHTDSTYDIACRAIENGAGHITHLFNAMRGLHHREPGIVGALIDRNVTAELICDGHHIHESVVRMMYKLCPEKITLVSDSISACGLPDGEYSLSDQKVVVKNKKALLSDKTIAGSTVFLNEAVQKAIELGVKREHTILSATLIPAKVIGKDNIIGSIDVGKMADLIVTDHNLEIEQVYTAGKRFV